jgi:hypothetical protein
MDIRRRALVQFHNHTSTFKQHDPNNPNVPGSMAILSSRTKGQSIHKLEIDHGDVELGLQEQHSPPHKDIEEGLYFFDASPSHQV